MSSRVNLIYNPATACGFRFTREKRHWKDASTLPIIRAGLSALAEYVTTHKIPSIAIPRIGCGLGGLKWAEVCPLLVEEFSKPEYYHCVVTILGPNLDPSTNPTI